MKENKKFLKILKLNGISDINSQSISNITNLNEDRAIYMGKILDKISENGRPISPLPIENKTLKELRILDKALDEFFLNGKTTVDEEILKNISSNYSKIEKKDFNLMTKKEKTNYLSQLYEKYENELIYILKTESPEKKIEFFNKYIDDEIFDEENYLKKIETQKTLEILKEFNFLNSSREKQEKLREEKEKENRKNVEPIYNKQLYKIYEDDRLTRDKQDILKQMYFKKGINLDEFKKNLGNEIYNCSEDQLKNYVELWDKYQRNYISKDDFYYGKNIVFKEEISQKAIKETVIPILQEDAISKNEITECINSSLDEGDDFFKEVTNLAIVAKENNYQQDEIYEIIKDATNEPISKIHEEIELIENKKDNELNVNVLKNLDTDEISIINKNNLDFANKDFEINL